MRFKNPHTVRRQVKDVKVTKNINKQIFVDKIVDRRTNPTLYNIEAARSTLAVRLGSTDNLQAVRSPAKKTNQQTVAIEVLAQMNVLMVDIPKNYSLLESNSDKEEIINPLILDTKDFNETVNNTIIATDKFIYADDPFYQLDDMPNLNRDYTSSKSELTKEKITKADPSFIVSNLTILNNSPTYFGRNKYL